METSDTKRRKTGQDGEHESTISTSSEEGDPADALTAVEETTQGTSLTTGNDVEPSEDVSTEATGTGTTGATDDASSDRVVIQGGNITFKTRMLNEYLTCQLCMGYLREAFTTQECLHAFCKSCIYKHLLSSSNCPQCNTVLGPNPFEKVRFDRTLNEIVHKVVPNLVKLDIRTEQEFYAARGLEPHCSVTVAPQFMASDDEPKTATATTPSTTSSAQASDQQPNQQQPEEQEKQQEDTATSNAKKTVVYQDQVRFRLDPDPRELESADGLRELDRPFISTSASVTVLHVKKFLMRRFGLDSHKELEILYKKEVLGAEHSINYILKTRGHIGGDDVCFVFRRAKSFT